MSITTFSSSLLTTYSPKLPYTSRGNDTMLSPIVMMVIDGGGDYHLSSSSATISCIETSASPTDISSHPLLSYSLARCIHRSRERCYCTPSLNPRFSPFTFLFSVFAFRSSRIWLLLGPGNHVPTSSGLPRPSRSSVSPRPPSNPSHQGPLVCFTPVKSHVSVRAWSSFRRQTTAI